MVNISTAMITLFLLIKIHCSAKQEKKGKFSFENISQLPLKANDEPELATGKSSARSVVSE